MYIQSVTGENLTEAVYESQTDGKGIVKSWTVIKKGMSHHHFVQRLLLSYVREQLAKPQVLMRSQQKCSQQEEKRYWTECTEYVCIE